MKYILLFLICFTSVQNFSQIIEEVKPTSDVEIEDSESYTDTSRPFEKWNPENPKAIPPLEMLQEIDTIRKGLYKSVYGINLGYDTGEYFRGYFNDEETVIPFDYYFLPKYSNFMIVKKSGGNAGVIDSMNRVIIPFDYKGIYTLHENKSVEESKYLRASKIIDGKSRMGMIDKSGKVIIPFRYKKIKEISPGIFSIANDSLQYGFYNLKADITTPCKYTGGIIFKNEDFIKAINVEIKNNRRNTTYGVINSLGKEIVPVNYRNVEQSLDKKHVIAETYNNQKFYSKIYDSNGKIVFEMDEAEVKNLTIGSYFAWQNRKEYFIIKDNFQKVIPSKHSLISLSNNLYQGTLGFRNRKRYPSGNCAAVFNQGEEILPCEYRPIVSVHDDLFFASKLRSPLYGAYDSKGKEVIPPTFSNVIVAKNLIAVAKPTSYKFALMDSTGKEITNYIYDDIEFSYRLPDYKNFKIIANRGEEIFELDEKGKEKEYKSHQKPTFRKHKNMELDRKISNEIEGNYYRYFSDSKNQYLIQYSFQKNTLGKKIIHVFTSNQKHYQITQTISKRITNVNAIGEIPWLWMEYENVPHQKDLPKSILNDLNEKDLFKEKEDFMIEIKYPYREMKVVGLNESEFNLLESNDEVITKHLQVLKIQELLNRNFEFVPVIGERIPKIKVDLKTQQCYFTEKIGINESFNKVILEDGKWHLIYTRKIDTTAPSESPFIFIRDIFYKNSENEIIQGNFLGYFNTEKNTFEFYVE